MKYWNSEPVLKKCNMISKPSRRIRMTKEDVGRVVRGFQAGMVKGLVNPGECMFLVTRGKDVLEAREAWEKGIGGMPLCRAY